MNINKNNIKGIIVAILFHGILVALLMFFAFSPPVIEHPDPEGIAVIFGEEVQGEASASIEQDVVNPSENQTPQEAASAPSVSDIVTQTDMNSIEINKKNKPVVDPKPEMTEAEKEKKRQEAEFMKRANSLANSNLMAKPGNSTTGATSGKIGHIGGGPSGSLEGTPGNPFGNKDAIFLAKPLNTINCNLKIVLTLKINENGNVMSVIDYDTPLSEQSCIDAAIKQAKLCRFPSDPSREVRFARITYDYSISQR